MRASSPGARSGSGSQGGLGGVLSAPPMDRAGPYEHGASPASAGHQGLAVYVHVPFCLTRCHYCDFVTYTGMEGLRRPYAAALLAEAELATAELGGPGAAHAADPRHPPVVTSVFVGGGTPTLLPPDDLARVLGRLRELLPVAPDAEVTVEANPETVDRAVARGLVAAG